MSGLDEDTDSGGLYADTMRTEDDHMAHDNPFGLDESTDDQTNTDLNINKPLAKAPASETTPGKQ